MLALVNDVPFGSKKIILHRIECFQECHGRWIPRHTYCQSFCVYCQKCHLQMVWQYSCAIQSATMRELYNVLTSCHRCLARGLGRQHNSSLDSSCGGGIWLQYVSQTISDVNTTVKFSDISKFTHQNTNLSLCQCNDAGPRALHDSCYGTWQLIRY